MDKILTFKNKITREQMQAMNKGYDCGYFSKPSEPITDNLTKELKEFFNDGYDQGQLDRRAAF